MSNESINSKPPNVFTYNQETSRSNLFFKTNRRKMKPETFTHVKVDISVKVIHPDAFEKFWFLVEVDFSEGLTRIGRDAFSSCSHLNYINKLPSTLKEIDAGAFGDCSMLTSIEFPERLQVIGEHAFAGCRKLTRIKIPSAHVVIRSFAFCGCDSLVSVELPEGLQVIGLGLFCECIALTTVNVPSSVKHIKEDAFAGCTSLASLALPEGLQTIGPGSFQRCKSLESLRVPSTVRKIGSGAFSECFFLRSITLPERLETINELTFSKCASLTHIEIPPKVTKIGVRAFLYCEGLIDMRIPSSVVRIGGRAFAGCKQLTSVQLLGNLRTIEEATFLGCGSLTHVRVPSSVTRIEGAAFAACGQLVSLELPEGLETINLNGEYDYNDVSSPTTDGCPTIYGCRSLVNLSIPSEQRIQPLYEFHFDEDVFMAKLKLGTVVNDFDDLVIKLQHRFDTLAVHRLCYYQSYYPLTHALENLRQSMDADPSAGTKVDSFGMTPFHILALAQTPNLSLFQALMKVYQVDIIHMRDKFGSTPIDYLCLNHTSDSAMVIESLLETIFVQRLQRLGLARWKSDISTTMDEVLAVNWPDISTAMDEALAVHWRSRQREIGHLCFKLATYERLESLSLLELALWKVKINERKPVQNQEEQFDEEGSFKKLRLVESDFSQEEDADRQSSRIKSGTEVVISNVLPFLDNIRRNDYYSED
jgi:hypothetical protein